MNAAEDEVRLSLASALDAPDVGQLTSARDGFGQYVQRMTMLEFAERLGTSHVRLELLAKLLAYREAIRLVVTDQRATQWLNGSFATLKPVPGDIDAVTFGAGAARQATDSNGHLLFGGAKTKSLYGIDAYGVDYTWPLDEIVAVTTYWYELWSTLKKPDKSAGGRKTFASVPLFDVSESQARAMVNERLGL